MFGRVLYLVTPPHYFSTSPARTDTMAPITLPEYGSIEPLSEQAEVLVQSEDPEHVSLRAPTVATGYWRAS